MHGLQIRNYTRKESEPHLIWIIFVQLDFSVALLLATVLKQKSRRRISRLDHNEMFDLATIDNSLRLLSRCLKPKQKIWHIWYFRVFRALSRIWGWLCHSWLARCRILAGCRKPAWIKYRRRVPCPQRILHNAIHPDLPIGAKRTSSNGHSQA